MSRASSKSLIVGIVSVFVVAVVVIGIIQIESPGVARMRKLDDRRSEDLQSIQMAVEWYWNEFDSLPPSLAAIVDQRPMLGDLRDPVSNTPYEYNVLDSTSYDLCAVFQLATPRPTYGSLNFWHHGEGRECFRRRVERQKLIP